MLGLFFVSTVLYDVNIIDFVIGAHFAEFILSLNILKFCGIIAYSIHCDINVGRIQCSKLTPGNRAQKISLDTRANGLLHHKQKKLILPGCCFFFMSSVLYILTYVFHAI